MGIFGVQFYMFSPNGQRGGPVLIETYALKYWWCSPPRTGIASGSNIFGRNKQMADCFSDPSGAARQACRCAAASRMSLRPTSAA
jgi:hypothetical protein